MADINVSAKTASATGGSLEHPAGGSASTAASADPVSKEPTWDIIELLFFAYRDFVGDADEVLAKLAFGRAHHRVLHFVNRHSGLRVADLLDVLNITKQSLGRVLKQLIDKGYIVQEAGSVDRRERRLYPTEAGHALAARLAAPQLVRLAEALRAAGPGAEASLRRFLQSMINAEERPKVSSIMAATPTTIEADGQGEAS